LDFALALAAPKVEGRAMRKKREKEEKGKRGSESLRAACPPAFADPEVASRVPSHIRVLAL